MNSQELDPELLPLIVKLRHEDESIWDWYDHNGVISVLLIEAKNIAQAEFMQSIGLAGGEGRTLNSERLGDTYSFSHESRWIA